MSFFLFVLVSVFSEFLLALMGGNFSEFAFSSAGHFQSPFNQNSALLEGPYAFFIIK
jgi:hypothetical protein